MQSLLQPMRESKLWRERSPREQRLLLAAISAVLLAVAFLGLVEPALDGRQYWRQALPLLRAEHAQMQSLAKQLTTNAPPASADARPVDRNSLEKSLNDAGIKPISLEVSNGLIRARWSDVSFNALNSWLLRMQREQSWSVIEASLSARERIDRVDASVSLRSLHSAP